MKLKLSYFFFIIMIFIAPSANGQVKSTAPKDTTSAKGIRDSTVAINTDTLAKHSADSAKLAKAAKRNFERQLRIGADIARPIANIFTKNQYGYEFMADYTIRPETYLVAETGFGGGKIDYPNLKYTSTNFFFKLGIDRSMFDRLNDNDWDIITLGLRYGIGIGQRSKATYTIPNPFGQEATGSVDAKNYVVHWGEVTAGLRMEILPRVFAGWSARAKFMLNSGTFGNDVYPNYIAGYGKTYNATSVQFKTTSYDINFYVLYAIRWKNKAAEHSVSK